ncbi:MAG: zinc ribbon domain-containing protein [Clostridiales bacterium]|nr:zinc ribbon domain-containing protein [Clostridiales bacterium]
MKIESMICPQCGRSLQIAEEDQNKEFTVCPACGTQLHIDYERSSQTAEKAPPKDPRTLVMDDATGAPIAKVLIPKGWECHGLIKQINQSFDKPFQAEITAKSPDGSSVVYIRSGENFIDILEHYDHLMGTDAFAQGKMCKMIPYKMYHQMPLQQYMDIVAGGIFKGYQLTPAADCKLASIYGINPGFIRNYLNSRFDFQKSYEEMFHNPVTLPYLISTGAQSAMRKYTSEGKVHMLGVDCTTLEYESRSTGLEATYGLAGMMAMAANGNSKGHYVIWGSELIHACTTDDAHEMEATVAFMTMVSTFEYDPSIFQKRFDSMGQWFKNQLSIQAAADQQTAILQKQLAANQARLQQTLAENSRSMSNMIMDSWDKKMASDSRISQMQHEATMGVDTYVRTDGSTVEHSVVSDHVYQNQYGDTIGVSGPELDKSMFPDWTEINKQ